MDKPKVTPKDFFLWIGAMAALYAAVVAFVALIFDYINHAFPNPVQYGYDYDPYSSSISYETASLIVLTPVALLLMRFIRRNMAADPTRKELWVRRWALFLTIFIAGATFIIDLIVLLNAYLQGEDLTVGFVLKVLTVLLVAALGFMHFMADAWGYWEKEPQRAKMVNWAVGVLVLITLVAGFFIVGSPQQLRAQKQDAIRLQNLQDIQWQIVNYWQLKEGLPATLAELSDPISNNIIPRDPSSGEPYEYSATGELTFQLCAIFAGEGDSSGVYGRPSMHMTKLEDPTAAGTPIEDNWQHETGRTCFDRTIDPQRYRPFDKTAL